MDVAVKSRHWPGALPTAWSQGAEMHYPPLPCPDQPDSCTSLVCGHCHRQGRVRHHVNDLGRCPLGHLASDPEGN